MSQRPENTIVTHYAPDGDYTTTETCGNCGEIVWSDATIEHDDYLLRETAEWYWDMVIEASARSTNRFNTDVTLSRTDCGMRELEEEVPF